MLNIIGRRKIYFIASGVITLTGLILFFIFGINWGIDFRGGTLWELKFPDGIDNAAIREFWPSLNLGEMTLRDSEGNKMLQFRNLEEGERQAALAAFSEKFGDAEEISFETVGPTIGKEIKDKAYLTVLLSSIAIILYIAWAFRKVSRPISSWRFGVVAIIALIHDLLVMLTVFVFLGKFWGVAVDSFFITAMLTVLGYSVNDTIVIFDRIRERLKLKNDEPFSVLVNTSINETMTRSLVTGMNAILVLLALFFFGGASIHWFMLAMLIGVITGTYSSIFIASPLLVVWYNWSKK
ncbi:MAG: protein translocase subunit SecF [bacterium]|nr:protein translocase subunit SecF [bacterium]